MRGLRCAVSFTAVSVIQGDTALTPDQGITSGSASIQNGGPQIRQAAATARPALLSIAAKKFKVDPSDLSVTDGEITSKSTRQSDSYGALIGPPRQAVHGQWIRDAMAARDGTCDEAWQERRATAAGRALHVSRSSRKIRQRCGERSSGSRSAWTRRCEDHAGDLSTASAKSVGIENIREEALILDRLVGDRI